MQLATERDAKISALRKYLWTWVHVFIEDGRQIKGLFGCIDRDANLVLDRAFEVDDPLRHHALRNQKIPFLFLPSVITPAYR